MKTATFSVLITLSALLPLLTAQLQNYTVLYNNDVCMWGGGEESAGDGIKAIKTSHLIIKPSILETTCRIIIILILCKLPPLPHELEHAVL